MHQITLDISELARSGIQYRNDRMLPHGLKSCHAMNLSQICARPGISQDALTRLRHADKSSIARQVATLEEDGFITRVSCQDDKRVMKLYPTEKALQILPQIREALEYWETLLTQDFSEEEIRILTELLSRMKARAATWKGATE